MKKIEIARLDRKLFRGSAITVIGRRGRSNLTHSVIPSPPNGSSGSSVKICVNLWLQGFLTGLKPFLQFTICYSLFAIAYCLLPIACLSAAEVLQEVIVRDGDTLWGVANYYLKDPKRWPEILKHNPQLSSDPNIILPGMRLKVPILLIKEHLRAAYLIYILRDVRYRRRKETDWKKAWLNMELYEEDGVRTLEKSQANVKLPSGELLQLYENSLLIVRPEKPKDEVELLAGQVRASKTKIITADTVVNPKILPRTEAPDFKTKIKEDKTTLVEVYKGIIDVTAQGKTVTVKEGFGTEVKFKMAPSPPVKLPDMPDFKIDAQETPITIARDGKVELAVAPPDAPSDKLGRASIPFTPSGKDEDKRPDKPEARIIGSAVEKYRLQVSTSRTFTNIVHESIKKLEGKVSLDFKEMGLPDGLYFWRISYLDKLGFEGRFSPPRSFVIDTKSPEIRLISPKDGEIVDTDFIYVEGFSEPGITLLVNGVSTDVERDGKFLYALLAKEGVVPIKVEAIDSAGNKTVVEITVTKVRKGAKESGSPSSQKTQTTKGFPITTILIISAIIVALVVAL